MAPKSPKDGRTKGPEDQRTRQEGPRDHRIIGLGDSKITRLGKGLGSHHQHRKNEPEIFLMF